MRRALAADQIVVVAMPWRDVEWGVFIENDRGSMTSKAIRSKAERYVSLFRCRAQRPNGGPCWSSGKYAIIVLVCRSERRRAWIVETFKSVGLGTQGMGVLIAYATPEEAAQGIAALVRQGEQHYAEQLAKPTEEALRKEERLEAERVRRVRAVAESEKRRKDYAEWLERRNLWVSQHLERWGIFGRRKKYAWEREYERLFRPP